MQKKDKVKEDIVIQDDKVHVNIDNFEPRWYQQNLIDAIYKDKKKRAVVVWSRRSGKDILCWHLAIWQCIKKVCTVFYIFPTFLQARAAIWSGITIDDRTFMSYIPEQLIAKKNEARLEIHFINGSILALKGSNNYDSLRSTNPYLAIFSEYSYQNDSVFKLFLAPVLKANDGIAIFISTPFGRNHFYELFQIALNTEDWYSDFLTVEDTGHIDVQSIKDDVANGLISEDDMLQEYYCSFTRGITGSVYGKLVHKLRMEDRIGLVPYETGHLVHCSYDLGWDDATAIVFFQVIGQTIKIIDCYSNRQKDLEHYAGIIHNRGYTYGKHFVPHDGKVHELQTGTTRIEKLADLGIVAEVLPRKFIIDRIEDAKCVFAKLWIDEKRCDDLLKSLEHYRREWDDKLGRYKDNPVHDWSSDFADAFSYMAVAIQEHKLTRGLTQEAINAMKTKARGDNRREPFADFRPF